MLLLSPPKLLMILVIALIVLGPDKLPSVARRVGAMWSEFNRWRAHLETEVRGAFPDLPSTTEIARAVRSPITLLDRLADEHGASSGAEPVMNTDVEPVVALASETAMVGPPSALETSAGDSPSAAAEPDVSLMN